MLGPEFLSDGEFDITDDGLDPRLILDCARLSVPPAESTG